MRLKCLDITPGGKTAVADLATVELMCFPYHRKDNKNAYTFVAGCMQ